MYHLAPATERPQVPEDMRCGHYVAYVKQSGQWFLANDDNVSPVLMSSLRGLPYLVSLCRKDSIEEGLEARATSQLPRQIAVEVPVHDGHERRRKTHGRLLGEPWDDFTARWDKAAAEAPDASASNEEALQDEYSSDGQLLSELDLASAVGLNSSDDEPTKPPAKRTRLQDRSGRRQEQDRAGREQQREDHRRREHSQRLAEKLCASLLPPEPKWDGNLPDNYGWYQLFATNSDCDCVNLPCIHCGRPCEEKSVSAVCGGHCGGHCGGPCILMPKYCSQCSLSIVTEELRKGKRWMNRAGEYWTEEYRHKVSPKWCLRKSFCDHGFSSSRDRFQDTDGCFQKLCEQRLLGHESDSDDKESDDEESHASKRYCDESDDEADQAATGVFKQPGQNICRRQDLSLDQMAACRPACYAGACVCPLTSGVQVAWCRLTIPPSRSDSTDYFDRFASWSRQFRFAGKPGAWYENWRNEEACDLLLRGEMEFVTEVVVWPDDGGPLPENFGIRVGRQRCFIKDRNERERFAQLLWNSRARHDKMPYHIFSAMRRLRIREGRSELAAHVRILKEFALDMVRICRACVDGTYCFHRHKQDSSPTLWLQEHYPDVAVACILWRCSLLRVLRGCYEAFRKPVSFAVCNCNV